MPIFHKGKTVILYAHVPKTGGTYVERLLLANGFEMTMWSSGRTIGAAKRAERCPLQHMHREMLETLFHLDRFTYTFMTVREPVARLISEFRMRNPTAASAETAVGWMLDAVRKAEANPFKYENHIRPQFHFRAAGMQVFRHEDGFGARFVRTIEEGAKVQFSVSKVKRHMESKSPVSEDDIQEALTSEQLRLIEEYFATDYSEFGYARRTQ